MDAFDIPALSEFLSLRKIPPNIPNTIFNLKHYTIMKLKLLLLAAAFGLACPTFSQTSDSQRAPRGPRAEGQQRAPRAPRAPQEPDAACNVVSDIEFAKVVNVKGETETLKLDVYSPLEKVSTPRPTVVLIHGGGFHPGNDKTQRYIVTLCRELASKGCICISPDYRVRANTRYPFEGTIQDAVDDGVQVLEWVVEHAAEYHIDLNNLYIGGGSAGGVLSLNLLTVYPELCKTHKLPEFRAFLCLWGTMVEENLLAPLHADFPPCCFIHGTEDRTIAYSVSVGIEKRLRELNVDTEIHPVEGGGHTPMRAKKEIVNWMEKMIARTYVPNTEDKAACQEMKDLFWMQK